MKDNAVEIGVGVVAAGACGVAAAGTVASGGIAAPAAIVACGAAAAAIGGVAGNIYHDRDLHDGVVQDAVVGGAFGLGGYIVGRVGQAVVPWLRRSPTSSVAKSPAAPNRGIGAAPGSSYNPANLGQSYGSATVVPRPDLGITGFRGSANPADPLHGLNRAINRGVSPETILDTVRSPAAVLQQTNGRHLYLSQRGAVVLDDTGQVVTVWNRSDFNATNEAILADALGGG